MCACAGALAAGAVEAAGAEDLFGAIAAAGFLGLIVFPALFLLSALVRGIYAAWQPDTLGLVEDDGGAPRLLAWIVVVMLGCLLIAWAMFQGTWVMNVHTAFKPLTLSFVMPVIAITAALVAVAGARPAARLIAALARRIDRKLRRDRSVLRPRNVLVGVAVVALATVYLSWRLTVKPKIGPLDISVLYAPALAVMTTLLAHAVWRVVPRKPIAGGVLGVLTAASIASAMLAVHTRPSLTLEIWGDQPLAGVAIENLFDLDAIRARSSGRSTSPGRRTPTSC